MKLLLLIMLTGSAVITAALDNAPASRAKKTDAEIQASIREMLDRTPKMRQENIIVTVASGVATFTGTVSQPGAKGGVYAIASAAGAARVVNQIAQKGPSRK